MATEVRPTTRTFESFASEDAYIHVNEGFVERLFRSLPPRHRYRALDIAAATGLMTRLAQSQASARGAEIDSVLLDLDLATLARTRVEHPPQAARGYVCASAARLPFAESFDLALFANSIHMLSDRGKVESLVGIRRVLCVGGVLGVNSAFYDGAYPADSRPFYGRWMRRAVAEMNRSLPQRKKAATAPARRWLTAAEYEDLITAAGFRVQEVRERRVLLSEAAICAISSYKGFAMGALHATEEDAYEACHALECSVEQALLDVHLTSLPHNWLEIIAVKV
ncbi:MAG: class I SAM-dependent methyltransferase [Candidatus Dormibacteraceae bacterium]